MTRVLHRSVYFFIHRMLHYHIISEKEEEEEDDVKKRVNQRVARAYRMSKLVMSDDEQ